jgi:hypothetical protein
MGENINAAKEAISGVIEIVKSESSISEDLRRDYLTRLQFALNTLIQNERKIWLRTKAGKEMLGGFGEAAEKLLDVARSDPGRGEIGAALADVEFHAKSIDEETRRREMVVT